MAERIESLSQLLTTTGKDYLKEVYGGVIENVQKMTISSRLKNQEVSGSPTGGSVELKRFTNTKSQPYGTARSGGKGQMNVVKPVTLKIDNDREIIHEVEQKDVSLYGVTDLIGRKARQDEKSMTRELDRAFFESAVLNGNRKETFTSSTEIDKFEELVQLIETVSNDFVDGVPRDMIAVVMSPSQYGKLRSFIDVQTNNANVNTDAEEIVRLHGVEVYSSTYLPSGVEMLAMVKGSVGQMSLVNIDDPAKFPASNAYHFGIFYSFGTVSVMPDLIFYVANGATNLSLSADDSTTDNATDVTVKYIGYGVIADYYYKDNESNALAIGTDITGAGYTKGTVSNDVITISSTNGNSIAVVGVNADGKVIAGNTVKAVIA